ncbi:MAG: tetraacyldisaccharide 4'-kinase, partial [Alistipes sp.]
YKLGVTFRHRLFDWGVLKSRTFDVPVICIGNITVGGTGKTPMAEMVIDYMSHNHHVALISRGYGRRTKGYHEVQTSSHYRDVGDEPLQIKLKFPEAIVVVCEKRAAGIQRLCEEHPEVDLVVMDDGFQHRYVEPKINIVMIDATRPIQCDKMLPQGTLRDLPEMLHRAHYFVVTKCPENMAPIDRRILHKVLIQVAYQQIYYTRFESFMPKAIF